MLRVFITVAMGLALNLPSTVLGQLPELPVHPGDLIELRIGGAVHNGGLFDVDPTVTVSGALAMAGGPPRRAGATRCGCSGMERSSRPSWRGQR